MIGCVFIGLILNGLAYLYYYNTRKLRKINKNDSLVKTSDLISGILSGFGTASIGLGVYLIFQQQ